VPCHDGEGRLLCSARDIAFSKLIKSLFGGAIDLTDGDGDGLTAGCWSATSL
jgi:hypothetical protein